MPPSSSAAAAAGTHAPPPASTAARAGQPAPPDRLVDLDALRQAYHALKPDVREEAQRVAFGTSGHRGSSLARSFNEWHVLAITQAVCDLRRNAATTGPLFLAMDTHALSALAQDSALRVLAANGVEVMLAAGGEFTPTPALSHAIGVHNHGRSPGDRLADGIVMTPSHNPPGDGGFKYNPPHGGPAGPQVTQAVEQLANAYLKAKLAGVRQMPLAQALRATTTHVHDYQHAYVDELGQVIDMAVLRDADLHLGVDPMGGAGVHYWAAIAQRYHLRLSVLNSAVDPQFAFMPLDWDGQIRMDPSSPWAMAALLARKDEYDIAFACDTDHDRHGIVTPQMGLLSAAQFQPLAVDYLFQNRPQWPTHAAVGKTLVSTQLLDRVARRLGRGMYEVPVGFKWFVDGLREGALGFAGEESAGASFLRRNGQAWTTDKDGITAALLAAEVCAYSGRDLGELHHEVTQSLGEPHTRRIDAPATPLQKRRLAALTAQQLGRSRDLAGEPITQVLTSAPGNGAPMGGIKVCSANGWFAARPSGTEDLYKIYAESFVDEQHLQRLLEQAQAMVEAALDGPPTRSEVSPGGRRPTAAQRAAP